MFKRLFFLSGIIAFMLAFITTWFWYLLRQEQQNRPDTEMLNEVSVDSLRTDSIVE